MYTACHIINIWTKKTKQNKRNWHTACCAANKATLSTTLQSCELFIPAPAQFSGTSGSCTQFLHQCFLVFDQQWQTSATDTSKTIFMSDLLTEKVACLGSRSFTMEPHQSATPIVFFFLPLRWQRFLTVPYSRESITRPPSKDKVSRGLQCQLPHFGRWVQLGRTHTPWDFSAWIMSGAGQRVGVARRIPRDLRNLLSSPSAWTTALRRNAESGWQADGELPSPRGHRWELDNVVWGNPGLDAGGKTSTPSPFPAPTEVAMQCGHSGGGSAFGSQHLNTT